MAYRLVYTDFWNDPKVMEEMTPEDKYFYLYLLTNANTNMIGIYRIVKKQMAFDLGYSIESVNSLMERFISTYDLIIYNADTRELCIKNYGKYNLNKAGKPVTDCIKKELNEVKDKSLIKEIAANVRHAGNKKIIMDYLNSIGVCNDTLDEGGDDTSSTTNIENKEGSENEDISYFQRHVDESINDRGTNQKQNQKQNHNHNNNHDEVISLSSSFEELGFGTINKLIYSDLEIFAKEYTAVWVKAAMEEAVRKGVRNLSYVKAILENWKVNGFKAEKPKKSNYSKDSKNGLGFNNFKPREYDYDSLEKKLLGWDKD